MNKVLRLVVAVVVGALAAFALVHLVGALMTWALYSWVFRAVHEAGVNELLAGAVAVWCTAVIILVAPTVTASLFWRDRQKGILMVATIVSAGFVGLYFLSQPREGELFNPMTGQPMYRYAKDSGGKIELFPLGYRYHPRRGTELLLMTSEIGAEYEAQVSVGSERTPVQPRPSEQPQVRQPDNTLPQQVTAECVSFSLTRCYGTGDTTVCEFSLRKNGSFLGGIFDNESRDDFCGKDIAVGLALNFGLSKLVDRQGVEYYAESGELGGRSEDNGSKVRYVLVKDATVNGTLRFRGLSPGMEMQLLVLRWVEPTNWKVEDDPPNVHSYDWDNYQLPPIHFRNFKIGSG